MRLIDVDEAEKALAEQMAYEARIEYGGRHKAEDYLLIARAYFQNCPTIEAEPVRRGRWKQIKAYSNIIICDECGEAFGKSNSNDKWNYCPNCGAKMEDE